MIQGISFPGLLTAVFITLRLCHVISWSWWWVVSPLWITLILVGLFMVLYVVFLAIFSHRKF